MDFALIIVLMGFAEGMTIVYGFLAVIASIKIGRASCRERVYRLV